MAFTVPPAVFHYPRGETTMDYIVSTPCGQMRGTAGRAAGTVAYKGIRYAI